MGALVRRLTASEKADRWLRWCMSRYVELRGNVFSLDGCTFTVDSPAIARELKSQFVADRYERPEREALKRYLDPALPVIELGGSIGVVACLTNKRLTHPKAHVVVEANPDLIPLLHQNRDRNRCSFTVIHRALAYGSAEILFYRNAYFYAGNTFNAWNESPAESIHVPTITVREIADRFDFDRCTLICDIEGGEFHLLEHEADILSKRVVTFMVEIHEPAAPALSKTFFPRLERLGFTVVQAAEQTYVLQNSRLT